MENTMALRTHDTWQPVIGQRVQMRCSGIIRREGIVDAVTLDDAIRWIAGGVLQPQMMFQHTDGFKVRIAYCWESRKEEP
ncbi:hypothetical protein [Paenarthrobacter nicotinovorans]|uniref:hypothetical protein n=1 Tax=Paenarthrobacter nicotinovorans TaxID=29320 RepID=UPI003A7F6D1D